MPCPQFKTYAEVNDRLVALQSMIELLFDRLGYKIDPNEEFIEDVRAATLANIKGDIQLSVMNLNLIIGFEQKTITMDTIRMLGFSHARPEEASVILLRLSQYMQLSLIAMFQFRIENMITNILARMEGVKVPWQYGQKIETLLKEVSLDSQRNIDTMNILQFVRNSLHNNGVHNLAPMSITIDDCTFSFVTGARVRCAGWHHIVVAIEAILLLVEKILSAPKVRDIPAPISDVYVKEAKSNMGSL